VPASFIGIPAFLMIPPNSRRRISATVSCCQRADHRLWITSRRSPSLS
jgi:hypothetical protein